MTLDDIKRINAAKGLFFFSPDSMRFFRSRIAPKVFEGPGGVYFVTSEQFEFRGARHARRYTVTRFDPETGRTDRVDLPDGKDGFQAHPNLRSAYLYAAACAAGHTGPKSRE
jgi:hypothetical protein